MASQILCGTEKKPVDVVRSHADSYATAACSERRTVAKNSQHSQEPLPLGPSVKDMPEYDPDAEINSLALTIPSWVRSLNRTRSTAEFSHITDNGRYRLGEELLQLISTADKLRSALEVK